MMKNLMYMLLISSCFLEAIAPKNFVFNRALRTTSRFDREQNPRFFGSPITITEPGIYVLIRDMLFNPTQDNDNAVVIEAEDVIVDLNLKSIVDQSITFTGVNGIYIKQGLKNVTIRNGSISNMTGNGIYVEPGNNVMDFFDLSLIGCGQAGVRLAGTSQNQIVNIVLSNVVVTSLMDTFSTLVAGFFFENANIITMENCVCSNNINPLSRSCGFHFDTCHSLLLKSLVTSNNTTGGTKAIGFNFMGCNEVLALDCASTNNISTSTTTDTIVSGFSTMQVTNVIFDGCSSVHNTSGHSAYGFFMSDSEVNQILNSQSFNNIGSIIACGVGVVDCRSVQIKGSQIASNTGGVDGIGVSLTGTALMVDECEIGVNLGLTGTSFGVRLLDAQMSFVTKNKIMGHFSTFGFGVFDNQGSMTNNVFLSNFAARNNINFSPGAPTLPIFAGNFTQTPGPLENISLEAIS